MIKMKPNFKKLKGLIPAIVQDFKTKKVLMLAFMNEEAWKKTLKTGMATYFSRSRAKIWTKGELSGNMQLVKEILIDCDEDTVLLKVKQVGKAACHKGYESCFFRKIDKGKVKTVGKKIFDPKEVYGK
jgi:phosphoribosyl-AMP cyclohydrolase